MKNGYARGKFAGRTMLVHRVSFETFLGPIPSSMTVDHLCFEKRCVNPDHLRLLTRAENAANTRRNLAPVCKYGHPRTEENVVRRANGGRGCRVCMNEAKRRAYHMAKAATALRLIPGLPATSPAGSHDAGGGEPLTPGASSSPVSGGEES